MGKIVKYCSKCDEGFAERFGFCPTCGAALQTFELNPVAPPAAPEEVVLTSPPVDEPQLEIAEPLFAAPLPLITETVTEPEVSVPATEPVIAFEPESAVEAAPEPVVEAAPEPVIERVPEPKAAEVWPPVAKTPVYTSKAVDVDRAPKSLEDEHSRFQRDGGFYVTVIEEKNVKTRNGLLLGTLGLMICTLMGALVYNIFSKDLSIGAINDDIFDAMIADIDPMKMEEVQQKKDKDKGGGGGGGGKEEKDPASQGDLADQQKTPTRPPDVNTMKSDTPMLQTPTTEGTMKFPKIYGKWGDPNGAPGLSNGPGTGGGLGSGRGTGQGGGNGTGAGNGDGSGFGNGNGNGNGNGTGDGGDSAPPPKVVGVTAPIKIISKPKPSYTDAARQNQVQGTVILRVTFLASGQIGSISPVKGLPNGLTEQAIAAARSIRFEPAKNNGIAQTLTKQVEYTFSIY